MRPEQVRETGAGAHDPSATSGFVMTEGSARRLGAACATLVEGLRHAARQGAALTEVTGFTALPSGAALTRGFADKGAEYLRVLADLEAAASRLEAGCLTSAALVEDTDAATGAALRVAGSDLDGRL